MRKEFTAPGLATATDPYSVGVQAGNLIFLSGQVACDRITGDIIPGNIKVQTKIIMDNIKYLLEHNGLTLDNIIKCVIHLTDYDRDFAAMNEVYLSYFHKPYPARFCGGVKALYPGCIIEIEAIVSQLSS